MFILPLFLASSLDTLLPGDLSETLETLLQSHSLAIFYIKEVFQLSTIPGGAFMLRVYIADIVPLEL
jgi:hypothetical protein